MIRIYDYLYELSDDQINQLYGSSSNNYIQSQWVCRAILQSLTNLSQNIIMRLLFTKSSISYNDLLIWYSSPDDLNYFNYSINELIKSRILIPINDHKDEFHLNLGFQESIKYNITGIHEPWCEETTTTGRHEDLTLILSKKKNSTPTITSSTIPTEEQLHQECIQKWNNILQYMITTDNNLQISETVINYLLEAGLMQRMEINSQETSSTTELHIRINTTGNHQPKTRLCITSKGYEYLLLDIQTQVWNFAYECLKKSGSHQIEVLSFLFMLSFCRVGNSYPVSQLTPIQVQLMMEFTHLGIIYRASPQSARFYPTQIAVNIIVNGNGTASHKLKSITSLTPELRDSSLVDQPSLQPNSSLPSTNLSGLELIVETNFQVVAYFTSDLHLAMLSLFVDNRGLVRLPNMALGQITRDSIKYALKMGIKAYQIINFMKIHSHPRIINRNPIIPENVTDQIKLWESERYRLKIQPSMYINLNEVTSGKHLEELYHLLKNYSQEINVLLWFDDQKKCLVVTNEGYYQLDAYARTLE